MPKKELDPNGNVFRWAAGRAHEHLTGVLVTFVGVPVVGAIVGAFAAGQKHPSVTDRVWQAVITAVVLLVVLGLLALFFAVVRAPYEQRDALRLRAGAGALEVLRWEPSLGSMVATTVQLPSGDKAPVTGASALDIKPFLYNGSWFAFEVRNLGLEAEFQIELTNEDEPEYWRLAEWDKLGSHETKRHLLKGERANAVGFMRGDAVLARFLGGSAEPLERRFIKRETTLGVGEVRGADEQWPPKDAAWSEEVQGLIDRVGAALALLTPIPPTNDGYREAVTIINELQAALRSSPVTGNRFTNRLDAVNETMIGHRDDPDAPAQWLRRYRECADGWRADLARALEAGTDA